ncbi:MULTISPECIES: glycoside hydrolase family 3 protein [unclassified Caulobacter]|uniref:glycoside hydrolase family 3 protein n=1 Tax=unclassified Caulobacter TaxID=2648921 RepID=UPI0006FF3C09|nr:MULTISPECIES: glycoside hydrolase family 3 N-terminal domain-containing protein [unclassified Caulobacter]KQV62881.1 beta-glucosidase [Caulobacter sp. Root342]KQV65701.1 beta-glucosidase [Caulobacter sp. Root343]
MRGLQRLLLSTAVAVAAGSSALAASQPELGVRDGKVVAVDGLRFRDLDRDGRLSPFEDWRLAPEQRAADLVSRMTLEEKAGEMMHGTLPAVGGMVPGRGQGYDLTKLKPLILDRHVTTFITRLSGDPAWLAEQNNAVQAIAEQGRLGVPVTVSTDPRHHFQFVAGASVSSGGFSQWPEATGLAAIGDPALVRRFGDIARQEYRAVGIHQALSPMADLATEPRWSRISGTFGEDPDLVGKMVKAYVQGFQGGETSLAPGGVSAVVKHWVGYGASAKGFDGHNSYGRYAVFPAGQFDLHVKPFDEAFAAGVVGVMPTYAVLKDLGLEQVGAGFSKQLLTDLLRGKHGFKGIVLSDWAITNDCGDTCLNGFPTGVKPSFAGLSTAWGVESLAKVDRYAKGVNAGLDQFGGVEDTAELVAAVKAGKIAPARIDAAARRILAIKFQQGLFENPYVDPKAAQAVVGSKAFAAEGRAAQSAALTLLENRNGLLPLKAAGRKVWLKGLSPDAARAHGLVPVEDLAQAELAIVRTAAPFQTLHPNFMFGSMQHEGDLSFKDGAADYEAIKAASAKVPTIVAVYLDRPAILTNVRDKVSALIGDFGAGDDAFLDALTGAAPPRGKLPFELPSSMTAVEAQAEDAPHDSKDPLYPIHFGLTY